MEQVYNRPETPTRAQYVGLEGRTNFTEICCSVPGPEFGVPPRTDCTPGKLILSELEYRLIFVSEGDCRTLFRNR